MMKKTLYLFSILTLIAGCGNSTQESDSSSTNQENDTLETPPAFTSALLLGMGGPYEDAKTYWIKFSQQGAEIDSMVGYYLSPQKEGFYIIQEVSASKRLDCDYTDYDGNQGASVCGWEASQLLVSTPDNYESNFSKVKDRVKTIAGTRAYCGEDGSDYEYPILIGKGFVEYTVGGQSSECAPDGPGGGFDKDTVISIGSKSVSPYVYRHTGSEEVAQAYNQLNKYFKNDDGSLDSSSRMFFTPEEMPVHFEYKHGQLTMLARNTAGRNHQDSWEEEAFIGRAPEKFQSNDFPAFGEELIPLAGEKENYIISPVDSTYGVFSSKKDEIVFYKYPEETELLRIDVGYSSIVMVEWCDSAHIDKWESEVRNSKEIVKR